MDVPVRVRVDVLVRVRVRVRLRVRRLLLLTIKCWSLTHVNDYFTQLFPLFSHNIDRYMLLHSIFVNLYATFQQLDKLNNNHLVIQKKIINKYSTKWVRFVLKTNRNSMVQLSNIQNFLQHLGVSFRSDRVIKDSRRIRPIVLPMCGF